MAMNLMESGKIIEKMINIPFNPPQTIYPQLAPCHNPVVNHTAIKARLAGKFFPTCFPNFSEVFFPNFIFHFETAIG